MDKWTYFPWTDAQVLEAYRRSRVVFIEERNDAPVERIAIYCGTDRGRSGELIIVVENPMDTKLWEWRLTPSGRPATLRRR